MESKGTLSKNKVYILANGLFLVIALLNINLYTVSINMYRIILLWIFGYSIVYISSFKTDEFINILKVGCLVLVFCKYFRSSKFKNSKIPNCIA